MSCNSSAGEVEIGWSQGYASSRWRLIGKIWAPESPCSNSKVLTRLASVLKAHACSTQADLHPKELSLPSPSPILHSLSFTHPWINISDLKEGALFQGLWSFLGITRLSSFCTLGRIRTDFACDQLIGWELGSCIPFRIDSGMSILRQRGTLLQLKFLLSEGYWLKIRK